MKLLTEISDYSLGLANQSEKLNTTYTVRKSARAILRNDIGLIAVQYLQNHLYHKLPGGGIENDESVEDALKREVLEEVGYSCELIGEIGVTIEYRNEHNLLHISYCYLAQATNKIGEPTLEKDEIEEGQITTWLSAHEALCQMKIDEPTTYTGRFILAREITFLEEYLKGN